MVEEVHQPDSGHAQEGNPLLTPDPGMVLWTWFVFFLFLIILRKFAWKPILASLDEREASIKDAFDDAEKARKALEEAMEKQRILIENGRKKASKAIDEAKAEATTTADDILEKARQASDKMVTDARAEIVKQKEEAVTQLRTDVESLSVLVASKLLDFNLDDDENRKRVKGYLKEVSG